MTHHCLPDGSPHCCGSLEQKTWHVSTLVFLSTQTLLQHAIFPPTVHPLQSESNEHFPPILVPHLASG